MAVYYKFKSAKDYDSVAVEGHFISVGQLKEKVFELKHLGRGTDFDLVVTNAQSNQEYLDEGMLIPKNTSVLIRRVPGRPRKPIVTAPVTEQEVLIVENNSGDNVQAVKDNLTGAQQSAMKYSDDLDWDEFGNDLYAMPEPVSVQSSVPIQDSTPVSKEDEDSMIKALIDTPALDWQRQPSDSFGPGRGFGRNMGGRNMGGRGFGRGGFENKKPPEGYICHRCKVPGHFIQHCPTNGDPTFDVKRFKPPTGIPKSMLIATPDGSYALPSGAVAVMKPNLDTFEKDMPSTRSVGELPPELHCPICNEVMKDAVLTSKCCFTSFCDKCIRDHIISKSMCVCGATSILADDLLPNKTLRDTINRILESNNSSDENGGRTYQLQDMESRIPQVKAPSPTQSAASRGQQQVAAPTAQKEESIKVHELVEEVKAETSNVVQKQENGIVSKVPAVSEATHDSRGVKEAASHGSAQLPEEEVHQKPTSGDAGKKKKKKKTRTNPGEADMHWRNGQEFAPENYMMPMGPSGFNPYWNGMQPGFDGFMPPPFHPGPMPPPYMGYGPGPMDIPFGGGMMPHDPFAMGGMMPYGPPPVQRDLAELAGFHGRPPPVMSREQFEAHKADLKRKREMERHREREFSKDRDYGREVNSAMDGSPMKSKSKSSHRPSSDHHHRSERHSSPDRRSRDPELPRPSSKKKSERDYSHEDDVYKKKPSDGNHSRNEDASRHHRSRDHDSDDHRHHRSSSQRSRSEAQPDSDAVAAEKKQKASVFSRISFPENESAPKRRKSSSASESAVEPSKSSHKAAPVSNGYPTEHSKRSSAVADMDHDSSDDERHFKRRPSRYTSSPPPEVGEEEGARHAKGSRERERDRGYSKYR